MIYLDNNATTRIDDEVLDTMLPYLKEEYGNASSIQHKLGRNAHQAVENSRNEIAKFLKVNPKEIFFNSGSTEAISTVIKGVYERYHSKGNHIITCQTEHKAVLATCETIEKKAGKVTYLPVNREGQIDLIQLENSITDATILVCIMSANNETGVIHPIAEIAKICQSKDVLFFCDATQSIGKQHIDLSAIPIDILCISAHKFHGPKGIGALFVRRRSKPIQIEPLIRGGKQENGFRAGTYNVPNIVGLGKAIQKINKTNVLSIEKLRDYFENRIVKEIEESHILGGTLPRLGNTSNIHFKYVRSSELMTKMNDIALSSGSACATGDRDPSPVLLAMHLTAEEALCCIRFSFSKFNSLLEIDTVIEILKDKINRIRQQSPIWQMYKDGLLE